MALAATADTVGTPWMGEPGIIESVSTIMARDAAGIAPPLTPSERKSLFHANRSYLSQSSAANQPTRASLLAAATVTPQSVGVSFLGAQSSDSGYIPPDSMGDVGPTQFLVCVNGRIRVFSKTGVVGPLDTTTDNFFTSVTHSGTSDPRVRYDRLSQRWFIVMIDTARKNNKILIAMSSGPTITGTSSFTFFAFQQNTVSPAGDNNDFADYPTLGVDNNALYIGVNMFGGNFFAGTTGFVVRKSDLLTGTLTVTAFRQMATGASAGPYTPYGVDNDDPNATEGYFVGVDNASTGLIVLRRVSNPGGTPTLSGNLNVTVPSTGSPLGGVVAKGVTAPLDDLDERLYAARMHHGSLWTAHNIQVDANGNYSSSGGRDGSRWYEIINLTTTPVLHQSGTVFDSAAASPASYWIPSCAVSGQGHMALGCSVAGVNEYAEIAIAGRLASDSLNTIGTPFVAQTSSTTYNLGSGTPRRWGDYSVVSVDPNDDMTLWTVQEYCNAANSWGVRVIQLKAPPPATAVSCSPASDYQGVSNIDVVVTGTSASGSGFFDPGSGYPNHISASIDGSGVTINSVTYTDPTHITINLSISGSATPGSRTITVTNPDGQAVVGNAGIFTVNASLNHAPVLDPIANKSINELSTLSFTATASDQDSSDTLTYSLGSGAPSGASINSTSGAFSWTPTEAQGPGVYSITVVVTDNGVPNKSDSKSFSVTVNEVNAAPMLTAISDKTVNELSLLSFTATATDSDIPANTLTYSLGAGAPSGASINSSSGVFTWTPTEAQGPSTNTVSVIVTDNGTPNLSATQTFNIFVNEVNAAPVLSAISDKTVNEGSLLSFTAMATDSDIPANALTYSLGTGAPAGASIGGSSGAFSWTPTEAQGPSTNTVSIIVTDDGTPSLSATQTFKIFVNEVNTAPVLTAITDKTVDELSLLMFTATATDSDIPANTLTYSLGAGAPSGASINSSSGVFTWTPTEAQGPSTNTVSVIVTDNGTPNLSATQTFKIFVNETNSVPVLSAISNRTVYADLNLQLTALATDPDIPTNHLAFSLTDAPTGAAIDPDTGVFSWTPDASFVGTTNSVTVKVTDDGSPPLSATQSFQIAVVSVPQFLSIKWTNATSTVVWTSIAGAKYRLEYKTDLGAATWLSVTNDITASGTTTTNTAMTGGDTFRFFRINVQP